MDGQVCYQADVAMDKLRDKVDKKMIATEGFVMLLDYNENRMVESGVHIDSGEIDTDVMLHVETVGKVVYI